MEVVEIEGDSVVVRLSRNEVAAARQALNEVLNGPDSIEEWEFQTRMGVTHKEAEQLMAALGRLPAR